MSTDYGIHCSRCRVQIVPDNMRKHDAETVMKKLKHLRAFGIAYKPLAGDVYITSDICEQFTELLDFIIEHGEHPLVITDEYGYLYPR